MRDIGIDLDGVLGNLLKGIETKARELYNIDISKYPITNYMLEICTPLTSEQLQYMFDETDLFSILEQIPFSEWTVASLFYSGYPIHIVTYRSNKHQKTTEDWLRGKLLFDDLYLVDSKDKRQICKDLGLEYFIEDRRETVLQLSEVCKECFLLDWPYNQGALPDNCHRLYDWRDIFKWL